MKKTPGILVLFETAGPPGEPPDFETMLADEESPASAAKAGLD